MSGKPVDLKQAGGPAELKQYYLKRGKGNYQGIPLEPASERGKKPMGRSPAVGGQGQTGA